MDYLNKLGKQAENMAGNLWGHGMILLLSLLFFTLFEGLLKKKTILAGDKVLEHLPCSS